MPGPTRRQVMYGTAAALASTGGGTWLDTLAARVAVLGGPGLLRSYDVAGAGAFDQAHANCAYVYDNAAAGLALLAGGRLAEARRLGDALLAAQARDRFWTDGRLRNAYAAGPVPATGTYPLPGWWDAARKTWVEDPYQAGTATGVLAWAMLLWLALHRRTGDARYQTAALRAAVWVSRSVRVTAGFSGGFFGWEPTPARLGWISTEHNTDLAVAFLALDLAPEAGHARAFVSRMWNPGEGRFNAGLTPDGSVNTHAAADANVWPLLAGLAAPDAGAILAWVLGHQGVPASAPDGIDFNDDRDGIWLEGTAYVALAADRAGRDALFQRMLATLRANTSPGGLVWATTVPRLTTGFSTGLTEAADFFYYRRPHVGATAWAALAQGRANPFAL